MFDKTIRPRAWELKRFRESIIIDGEVCTQEQFAEALSVKTSAISHWEQEFRGRLMPAPLFAYARITFDPLARAEWERSLPKRDQ